MPQRDNVTQAALAGFTASPDKPNPYLWSSTHWETFEVGRHCVLDGPSFRLVLPSRGSTYRVYPFGDAETPVLIEVVYTSHGGHLVAEGDAR